LKLLSPDLNIDNTPLINPEFYLLISYRLLNVIPLYLNILND